jgi:pimeloyl-ACP methyl ester carboxylesterase
LKAVGVACYCRSVVSSELHIVEAGTGEPVVLLHGIPSPPQHFRGLAAQLATNFRVIIPHMFGYGDSPPSAQHQTYGDRTAALGVALTERGLAEAPIVTFSGAALRALSLALDGTMRPRSMFFIAGLCSLSPEERSGFEHFASAFDAGADLRPLAAPRFLSPGFAAQAVAAAEVERFVTEVDRTTLAAELRELSRDFRDLTPRLSELTCPIVARHGTADIAVPIAHAEQLVAGARHAELQRVEGAGHALLVEDFEATTGALLDHLRRAG